jgi:hypothetical protein
MKVKYTGDRVEKRQQRGPVTAVRYSYSVNQPVITMHPSDFEALKGVKEKGQPRFVAISEPVVMSDTHLKVIAKLNTNGVKSAIPRMEQWELKALLDIETDGKNRKTVTVAIEAAMTE